MFYDPTPTSLFTQSILNACLILDYKHCCIQANNCHYHSIHNILLVCEKISVLELYLIEQLTIQETAFDE